MACRPAPPDPAPIWSAQLRMALELYSVPLSPAIMPGRLRADGPRGPSAAPHPQPLIAVDMLDPLTVYRMALPPQQDV